MNLLLILTAFMASLTGLLGDRTMVSVPANAVQADRTTAAATQAIVAPRAAPVAAIPILPRVILGDAILLPALRTIDWFGARRI